MGTFCSAITKILFLPVTPIWPWEVSLGKYDNWCLFIVIEICSTVQWNLAPQRLWLAAPGSKTSKIIRISTASPRDPTIFWCFTQEFVSAPTANECFRFLCIFHFVCGFACQEHALFVEEWSRVKLSGGVKFSQSQKPSWDEEWKLQTSTYYTFTMPSYSSYTSYLD